MTQVCNPIFVPFNESKKEEEEYFTFFRNIFYWQQRLKEHNAFILLCDKSQRLRDGMLLVAKGTHKVHICSRLRLPLLLFRILHIFTKYLFAFITCIFIYFCFVVAILYRLLFPRFLYFYIFFICCCCCCYLCCFGRRV